MNNQKVSNLCDACCEGHLHPAARNEKCEYKGTHGQLAIHFSVCDVCKAEILDASDLLENKREWVRFKKRVCCIPLGKEIAEMRKKHHLSQSLAADIFGGGPVAFSKYENDDLIPDESMVNLLKLAIAHPDTVRRLAKLKGIELLMTKEFSSQLEYFVDITGSLDYVYTFNTSGRRVSKQTGLVRGAVDWATAKETPSRPTSRISSKIEKSFKSGGKSWFLQ